jgi:hypothetical protein
MTLTWRILTGCGLLAVLSCPNSWGLCTGQRPEGIITCWQEALERRDAAALADLLAEDFVSTTPSDPQNSPFDKKAYVAANDALFRAPALLGTTATFGSIFCVTSADGDRDAWRISGLECTLVISVRDPQGSPVEHRVHHEVTWLVRHVDTPVPRFLVYREEIHPMP